jgi:phospholipid transport system substrate-binding protein
MEMRPMFRKTATVMLITITAIALSAGIPCAKATTPLEQVKGTVEGILALMRDEALSDPLKKAERREMIIARIDARFNFEEMSRRSLAKAWKGLSNEEKDQFVKLFSELLKNNYIGRIESYSDEIMDYAKEVINQNKKTRAKVYTNILRNGSEIPINYVLMKKGEEWFVYDVDIEGVSLVRNYRSEFKRILSKEKFAGLIKRLQEKNAKSKAERQK